ncbi:MAG: chromosome segregation protein SMC, partial [Synergistaceae bacterium]|nr:chromosome segregation protein SMC [Synergistaceae bacterium]
MYIARLQLKDFKSFGGAHELPFVPGMAAIVGPNGSGKSNILDSLRWVLGDSHSSKLRVTKQEGLIFHGSASRPKGTEASVSVQLREGTRVSLIRRRVAAETGAVVTVDGNRVTLSELDETKREWQLGGDKFAFIGQGEVAEVIQQRPQARRLLLESLFGIDAYRRRRDEASSRLGEAREEYTRLRTFSAELRARYDEITPEVERARAARGLLDALEEYRKLYYWVRRALNETQTRENDESKRRIEYEAGVKRAWLAGWNRAFEVMERDIAELSNSRQSQIKEMDAAKETMAGITRTAYGYGASLVSISRRIGQMTEDRASASRKLEGLKKEDEERKKSEKSLRGELEQRKKSLSEAMEKQALFEERSSAEREKAERINRERGEIEGEMTAMVSRMKSIGAQALRSRERRDEAASSPDPLKSIRRELEELERRHNELLDEQEKASSRHRDVYAQLQGASGDLQRNRRELSKMSNKLSELQEQAASEIYPRPVQHVLSAVKLGRVKANLRAVIDAFSCPPELAAAMEAFLGGRQFMILTDSMDEAGACIDILKKNQMGRATFLPLERSRPRSRDYSYRLPNDGVVGWAMELVKSEEHWRPALEHIMGDLLIVDDYRVGQNLVRAGFKLPVATLEGDVFQPGGTISGGRAAKSGRAMEIMSAISRLEAETDTARRLVDSLSASFSRLEEEEAAAAAKKEEISREIRELASRRSSCDERREEITRERARARSERESMMASLKECGASYLALFKRRRELSEEAETIATPEADLGMVKEIEGMKGAVAIAEEKLRSWFVLAERMAAETRAAAKQAAELDEEISSGEREILAARANLASLARRYAEAARLRRSAARGMDDFKERYDAITARRERMNARVLAARAALQAAESSLSSAGVREAELSRELVEIVQTWEEQYPYPGPGAVTLENPDELRRNIRECDRNLKAMGDVDMGVLSEERSLKDRLAFLGEQLDDVGGGMRELERLISEADEQARAIFTNALEEIDRKFNALFQRLFTGGDARLEMIEGESLWDSGVDVVARPPGKHPASIAQLSGGEQSLSAIALLFASLEVASCPIAVLDEVDAALDEVNLRRFAELARDASRERQIFVMTHRRLTMERADVL